MGVKFNPPWNATMNDRLEECPTSADKAAEFLKLLIEPLRNGQPIHDPLASFLADAIEEAMAEETTEERIKMLTDKLYLTANNRRPEGNWLEIGKDFDECLYEEITRRESRGERKRGAPTQVAKTISKKYKIKPQLARSYWDKWTEAKQIGELE